MTVQQCKVWYVVYRIFLTSLAVSQRSVHSVAKAQQVHKWLLGFYCQHPEWPEAPLAKSMGSHCPGEYVLAVIRKSPTQVERRAGLEVVFSPRLANRKSTQAET